MTPRLFGATRTRVCASRIAMEGNELPWKEKPGTSGIRKNHEGNAGIRFGLVGSIRPRGPRQENKFKRTVLDTLTMNCVRHPGQNAPDAVRKH